LFLDPYIRILGRAIILRNEQKSPGLTFFGRSPPKPATLFAMT
jgi:hypothetical protein